MTSIHTSSLKVLIECDHTLEDLQSGGCALRYSTEHCCFSELGGQTTGVFHLIHIPQWKSQGRTFWAPEGFEPVGLKALINLGVEHPELQERRVIVATGAPDDRPPAAIYHPYLSRDKGIRLIGIPNFGVGYEGESKTWEGEESNLFGLFRKVD